MKLKYDAVKFIIQEGDGVIKLHLLQFLNRLETADAHNLILQLIKSQMPSGGFPSEFNKKIEGVRETCRNTLLLLNCGIPSNQLNIQSAISFLLKHQTKKGGWTENPKLVIPENVIELSTNKAVTWLTADIISLLRYVRLEKNDQYAKALNWLKSMQNEGGSWPMLERDVFKDDPDSSAQILFLMRDIYGTNNPIWEKGIKYYEIQLNNLIEDIEREYHFTPTGSSVRNDIYHLTYLLLASLVDSKNRIEYGYDLNDKRVKKIVRAIICSQEENGGWIPFWTDKSDPMYTTLTLKLLLWLGVLNTTNLINQYD